MFRHRAVSQKTPAIPVAAGRAGSLPEPAREGESPRAIGATSAVPPELAEFQRKELAALTHRQLMGWMFAFLKPVKSICVLACVYLSLSIAAEVLTTWQMGNAVDHIKEMHRGSTGAQRFWGWFIGGEGRPFHLRSLWDILLGRDVSAHFAT